MNESRWRKTARYLLEVEVEIDFGCKSKYDRRRIDQRVFDCDGKTDESRELYLCVF